MGADGSVGDPHRDIDYALAGVAAAYEIHHPGLLAVGYGEGLALGAVAVGVCEGDYCRDGFACRARTLERDVYKGTIVDEAVLLHELFAAAVGRFADNELVLIHVAYGLEGLRRLGNPGQVAPCVPLIDGKHGAFFPARGLVEIELAEEHVRIGGV